MRKVHLVWFGLGGHVLQLDDGTLSGYETPEMFEAEVKRGSYREYALEGSPVIDKRAPLERDPSLSVRMPLVDPKLPARTVSPFGEDMRRTALEMAPGLDGWFRTLALTSADPDFRGLDSVGVDVYVDLWRKAGARIGRFEAGEIKWEK